MNILKSGIKWNYPLTPLNQDNIQYIVVHHVDAVLASPLQVDEWDKENGWNGAGYNYYVRKDGSVYEMRGDNVGAQCLNYNWCSYGIGCEGDYEEQDTSMPDAQYNALLELVQWLKDRFPNAQIVGHKELFNTACPGQYFPLDEIKSLQPREVNNWVDWHTILAAACDSPEEWEKWINNHSGDGMGQYLPMLIEKIYNFTHQGKI